MRKSLCITALSLCAAGILLVTVALFAINFDFSRLDTNEYTSKTYTIEEGFFSISANMDTTDIQFLPSDDGTCRVVCEQMNLAAPITAEVLDNQLYITQENFQNWYDNIGFSFKSAKVTVYLPYSSCKLSLKGSTCDVIINEALTFSKVDVEISTGDIECYAQVSSTLSLKASTGSIRCLNAHCTEITLKTSTGSIQAIDLDGLIVDVRATTGNIQITHCDATSMTVHTTTGNVQFKYTFHGNLNTNTNNGDVSFMNCNGDHLYITTRTGDVTGTFSRRMVFFYETNTGNVDVEKYDVGGKCEVVTDTGNIELSCK